MNPCSSILSKLLLSNCPPGPLETGTLHAEADRLQSRISALRKKLEEYEGLLQQHRTVLSIARKVPLDVWGLIFSFVLPDCSTPENWRELTNLNLVCRDWYQAARSAYRFSSHITVRDTKMDYEQVMSWSRRATEGRSLQFEATYLTCPLHYDAASDATDSGSKNGEQDAVATVLECRLATPALLRLLTDGPILDHLLFKNVGFPCYRHLLNLLAAHGANSSARPWGSLKKLTLLLDPDGWDFPEVVMSPEATLDVPPCISSLDLKLQAYTEVETNRPPSLLLRQGNFERLTSFSLKWAWADEGRSLLAALGCCINLENLTLNFQSCPWSYGKTSGVVAKTRLPKLRNFNLAKPSGDSIKFLKFISTPALIRLDVHIRDKVEPENLSSFIAKQFSRSQGTLRVSMRVSHRGCYSGWNIPKFLAHIPHIAHLTLDGCVTPPEDLRWIKNGPDFFHELGCQDNNLPHLEVLEILDLPPEIPIHWLENYLEVRADLYPNDRLKTVVVKFGHVWLPDSCTIQPLKSIERMRSAGLSIHVEHPKVDQEDLLDIYFK